MGQHWHWRWFLEFSKTLRRQEPVEEGNVDQDPFRKAMAVRKQRSKMFVSNEFAAFNILFALTFHYVLTRVTATAFALMNADRDDIVEKKLSQHQELLLKKRLRFKGAEAFQLADQQHNNPGSTTAEVFTHTSEVIDLLWRVLLSPEALAETVFGVPVAFWPQGNPRPDMLHRMAEDVLKTLSGLKWRLLYQSHMPPYKYICLQDPAADASEATTEFLAFKPCCLDPFWGRPIQAELKRLDDFSEQVAQFHRHIRVFATNCRGVSSREENMHAAQRAAAGGWKSKAALFPKQAADSVLRNSMDNFTSRTGIVGNTAPAHVKAASRVTRTKKIIHKRPRQYGNAMFFFIACKKREGTTKTDAELKTEWFGMPAPTVASWKAKHVVAVAGRRVAQQQVARHAAEQAASTINRSPWGIGDNNLPLKEEHLQSFLKPFQNKATGLQALGQCTSAEALELLRAYQEDGKKFHSSDAAISAAKEAMGKIIDDHNCKENTWGEVMGCTREAAHCFLTHPGLCQKDNEEKLPKVQALVSSLPKGNNILMFELGSRPARERVVVFTRVIAGRVA